ncbi:hypothetical protein D3C74_123280 [compost metagenome]
MPVSRYKVRKLRKSRKAVKKIHLAGTKRKRITQRSGHRKNRLSRSKGKLGRHMIAEEQKSARLDKSTGTEALQRRMLSQNEGGLGTEQIVAENVVSEGRNNETDEQETRNDNEMAPVMHFEESDISAVFEEGFRQGYFEGGEGKVSRYIPRYVILPEMSVDDVISTGVRALSSYLYPLVSPAYVFEEINDALNNRTPLSVIRLGDGEVLTLAHETIISLEQAKNWGKFLPYAGVHLPDYSARESLAESIRYADIVGIPESRHPSYQGLLFPVFKYYGMDYRNMKLTTSTVNYALNEEAWLSKLLTQRRIILIGNQAPELARWFQIQGYEIVDIIAPVQGAGDVERIMEQVAQLDFDIALVAAGIAAVVICTRIAREKGKVALDMGHLADMFVKGEAPLL